MARDLVAARTFCALNGHVEVMVQMQSGATEVWVMCRVCGRDMGLVWGLMPTDNWSNVVDRSEFEEMIGTLP